MIETSLAPVDPRASAKANVTAHALHTNKDCTLQAAKPRCLLLPPSLRQKHHFASQTLAMDDSASSATGSIAAESPAQEKARLRRERRAAKIAGGGVSRLQAISSLQGGSHRDIEKDVPGTQLHAKHAKHASCHSLLTATLQQNLHLAPHPLLPPRERELPILRKSISQGIITHLLRNLVSRLPSPTMEQPPLLSPALVKPRTRPRIL